MNDKNTDPQTYAIIGAAMEVHRHLGHGFLEAVYQDALEIEFRLRSIPCQVQLGLPVEYEGRRLGSFYCADFLCYESILVEIKALSALSPIEYAQVINYLKASGMERGLLINFGSPSLEYKRFIFSGRKGRSVQRDNLSKFARSMDR